MGFEYKIVASLAGKQQKDIQQLLKLSPYFEKSYLFNNQLFFDFRYPENNGKMPNLTLVFEADGIYICQYSIYIHMENA